MKLPIKGRHIPGRIAAGAFILNSGLEKARGDEQTAAMVHGMASGTYPFLGKMKSTQFLKVLSTSEITLGAALLLPFVPTIAAGAGGTTMVSFGGSASSIRLLNEAPASINITDFKLA